MKTSAWDSQVSKMSPNGEFSASINDAMEVAMGAPTRGTLIISNGIEIENCNPSIVWSEDSRFVAVPQWTPSRGQRLIVIDVEKKQIHEFPQKYAVLELDSFKDGIISGVDSPIYQPKAISRNLEELNV